jgi:hypothetical protein
MYLESTPDTARKLLAAITLQGSKMADRIEIAELLTALWRLGAPGERMPTSHGILDRALHSVWDRLPPQLREALTFSNTSVGLRCLELPAILLSAQEALLTSEPNPTYLSTDVILEEDAARQIVVGASIPTRDARAIGVALHEAVESIRTEIGTDLEPVAA